MCPCGLLSSVDSGAETTFAGGVLPVLFDDKTEYIGHLFLYDFCFIKFRLTIAHIGYVFLIFETS